jgi:ubiquinone/menaquinone biosynthesis C-methylase UbiE
MRANQGRKLENGLDGIKEIHHQPYIDYYEAIRDQLNSDHLVLEIAAGSGRHTNAIIISGATTTALDISEVALSVLITRTMGRAQIVCSLMEETPFESSTFDYVLSCGGLSYADNTDFLREIKRILKPGGGVIFLDTLNHNPIYKLNRFIRFLRNERTYSTLKRMPTLDFVTQIQTNFECSSLKTYGQLIWLRELVLKVGIKRELTFLDRLENRLGNKSAFKFLLVSKNLIK